MNGRQFIASVRKWARSRNLEVRFVASEGAGSHGTLYAAIAEPPSRTGRRKSARDCAARCLPTLGSTGTRTAGSVVAFPDFGWGATDGANRDEALAEAKDLLRELIATTIREGKDLPEPSRAGRGRPLVVPPVQIALKAALYEAWREAGISQRRLARDVAESEVRRMLNPEHSTKAATIDRALRRLGKRVTVTVGEAA